MILLSRKPDRRDLNDIEPDSPNIDTRIQTKGAPLDLTVLWPERVGPSKDVEGDRRLEVLLRDPHTEVQTKEYFIHSLRVGRIRRRGDGKVQKEDKKDREGDKEEEEFWGNEEERWRDGEKRERSKRESKELDG